MDLIGTAIVAVAFITCLALAEGAEWLWKKWKTFRQQLHP